MTTNRQQRRRRQRRHKARAALRHARPSVWLDRHPAPRPSRREFRTGHAFRSAVGRFAVDAVTQQLQLQVQRFAALYRTPRRRHGD